MAIEETAWQQVRKEQARKNREFFNRTRDEFYKKMGWPLPEPEERPKTNTELTNEKKEHLRETLNRILK